jgi:molecular chaperone GrpE
MADEKEPQLRVVDRRWWARGGSADSDTDDGRARKPTFVEALEQQLADRDALLQRLRDDHRRANEDFEQARIRLRRDVGRDVERARRAILTEFLEVLDNLDRAASAVRDPAADREQAVDRLARGVELVREQFLAKLQSLGVTRIEALGQQFDATRHDAVTTTPVDEADREGTVVDVVRPGYAIGDDILRPASVVVGARRT